MTRRSVLRYGIAAGGVMATSQLGLGQVPAAAQSRSHFDERLFRNPPSAFRPWVYWWWPGGAVKSDELRRELAELSAAGFGGANMTWLALGVPHPGDPSVASWGTPSWRKNVADALRTAQDHDMRIDLTSATSWPFNSPATTPENGLSSQELVYQSKEVTGPGVFEDFPPGPDDTDKTLVAVTAARTANTSSPVKPRMLEAESVVDITGRVGADGRVRWTVPSGAWIVFGLWRKPTRQQPTFGPAAPSATYAIDHFERKSVEAATRYYDEHVLAEPVGSRARSTGGAIYLDSLEVAAHGLLWTADLPQEFERRRGYSVLRYLPVLFIAGQHDYFVQGTADDPPDFDLTGGAGARVRHDYYETLTDLYIDDQLKVVVAWAGRRGLSVRAQPAYGTTLDPIRTASHLPELETETLAHRQPVPVGSPTFRSGLDGYRMTVSGGHIGSANTIGIELGAVFNRDYTLTLADAKSMIDQAYAAGVNQVVLHGYPYRDAPGASWPSWHPFSSESLAFLGFSEVWSGVQPQWRHIRGLTDYIARNNVALQHGKPRVDLAVYHDGFRIADVSSPDPVPVFENTALESAGYTYGFVDPVSLAKYDREYASRRLFPDGPSYQALIVKAVDAMPGAAADRILSLAQHGLPVVIVGDTPRRGTSLRDAQAEDRKVASSFASLVKERTVRRAGSVADVPASLRSLGVEPRVRFGQPVPVLSAQRDGDGTSIYYLWHPGPAEVRFDASCEATGQPAILDAWSGTVTEVAQFVRRDGRTEVPLRLAPGESVLLMFDRSQPVRRVYATGTTADSVTYGNSGLVLRDTDGGTYSVALSDGSRRTAHLSTLPAPVQLERWHLTVEGSAPEGTDVHELELDGLHDWRSIAEIQDVSGVGRYRATVHLDAGWKRAAGAYLDLGTVSGSARVRINGSAAGDGVVAGTAIEIRGRLLRDGVNTIEVEVATTLRNRLLQLAHSGDPRFARFLSREAAGSGSQPAGLIGPVRLVPFAETAVAVRQGGAPAR